MRVIFQKSDDGRRCSWRAELPGNRRLEGSTMAVRSAGTDLPHDLAQLVVEADLGLEHGFWRPSSRDRPVPARRRRGPR
jgi:hypothetical protein